MGVDYYACKNCHETFADCGNYFGCECGESFCSDECGDKKMSGDYSTCMYCREEVIDDYDMIQFLLARLNITYAQAMEIYKKEKK